MNSYTEVKQCCRALDPVKYYLHFKRAVFSALLFLLCVIPFSVFAEQSDTSPGQQVQNEEINSQSEPVSQENAEAASEALSEDDGIAGQSMLMGGGAQAQLTTPTVLNNPGNFTEPNSASNPGAFVYEYQFKLPPGRNDMTPDLRILYSSRNTEDEGFGYGWSITIPYIERFNKTGFDAMYSTTSPSKSFYSSLSGELVNTTSDNYVARNDDGSNLQYVFNNNTWVVRDKNGIQYEFGMASTSRQEDPDDSGKTYKWFLKKVVDTNGNYITYSYTRDKGQVYPSNISYTNHTPSGTGNYFEVDFILGLRATTTATSSVTGFPVVTRYKVDEVEVQALGTTTQTYSLDYTIGDNNSRLMLNDIVERGVNSSGGLSLPATVFDYTSSDPDWDQFHIDTTIDGFADNGVDMGVGSADVNGDGLIDLVQSRETWNYSTGVRTVSKEVQHKDLISGDYETATYTPHCYFNYTVINHPTWNTLQDGGGRLVEFNGDGRADMFCDTTGLLNNGTGWATSTLWTSPVGMRTTDANGNYIDAGVRFADVNGDGLTDILKAYSAAGIFTKGVYLNDGSGWNLAPSWVIPNNFDFSKSDGNDGGGRVVDVNGDNLADLYVGLDNSGNATSTVYINNGNGWNQDDSWILPTGLYAHLPGVVFFDINSDGLTDVAVATGTLPDINDADSFTWEENKVYLNTGKSWAQDVSRSIPVAFAVNGIETSPRFGNIKGLGLTDIYVKSQIGNVLFHQFHYQEDVTAPPDLLRKIDESGGKEISAEYRSTSNYTYNDAPFNPELPFYFPAINTINYYDGVNSTSTEYFNYQGGRLYFASSTDRRSSGFDVIYKLDGTGDYEALYFHTGNVSSTTLGEYQDDQSKIGKIYRQEFYAGDGALPTYQVVTTKWDTVPRSTGNFVFPIRRTVQTFDGLSSSKDSAKEMTYSSTTGNVTQEISWGEVTASDDGSFTDIGSDKIVKNISYASSSTAPLSKVSQFTTLDQTGTILSDSKLYYDQLSLGSITNGNLTLQEDLKSGTSTYIKSISKTYNSYGLPTQEIGPRNATTTYSYDSLNLYPATTTNALGHSETAIYNYDIGLPFETYDQNGSRTSISYDALNRVKVIQKPNPSFTPTHNTVVEYTYNDSTFPRSVKQTNHHHNNLSVDSYSYYDGFGKLIETRDRAEASNTYKVRVFKYTPDMRRYLSQETEPFFDIGTAYEGTIPDDDLITSYYYDPLGRVEKITNAYGDTLYTNSLWGVTVEDPLGNTKTFHKDAFGNLSKVVEKVGVTTGTTTYAYDGNNNLTQLTDALGNVRNFTYDKLGHMLTAEDLHASADTSYGIWQYSYDDSGNVTQTVSPRSKTTNYTYDILDRILTEDSTDTGYTDNQYGYDDSSVSPSKGYLTSVSTPYVGSAYTYDIRGNLSGEQHYIPGHGTTTTWYYYNRQNNLEYIEYDDYDAVGYNFNAAGLINAIYYWKDGGCCWESIIWNLDYSPKDQITTTNGYRTQSFNTYDADHHYRLTQRGAWNASDMFQNLYYYYDGVGNIYHIDEVADTDAARWMHYTYDDLYRLTSASSSDLAVGDEFKDIYEYNLIGNITSKAGTSYLYQGDTGTNYANPHAPTSVGGVTYTYDEEGNLLSNGTHTNTWNYRGELTQTVTDQGTTTSTSTYTYNHNGERISYTDSSGTTFYPNQYISVDFNGDKKKYIYNGGDIIATIEGDAATSSWYISHFDHLGGANVMTKHTIGDPVQVLDYYPFGEIRVSSSTSTFDEVHKFTGHEFDREASLTYAGARYYDQDNGKWLSQDPAPRDNPSEFIHDPQQLNLYAYSRNNPLIITDPNGEDIYWSSDGTLAKVTPNGNSQYFEGNDMIMIKNNAAYISSETNYANLGAFYDKVHLGAKWDYKNNDDGREYYFFDGKLVEKIRFGNLHYGYVGSAAGFNSTILKAGGGYAQTRSGNKIELRNLSSYLDDPADTREIEKGIDSYKKNHKSKSSASMTKILSKKDNLKFIAKQIKELTKLVNELIKQMRKK